MMFSAQQRLRPDLLRVAVSRLHIQLPERGRTGNQRVVSRLATV